MICFSRFKMLFVLFSFFSLFYVYSNSFAAMPVEILSITTGNTVDVKTVNIKCSNTPSYRVFLLSDPSRYLVDFTETVIKNIEPLIKVNEGGIEDIKVQQMDKGLVRLILTLDSDNYKVKSIKQKSNLIISVSKKSKKAEIKEDIQILSNKNEFPDFQIVKPSLQIDTTGINIINRIGFQKLSQTFRIFVSSAYKCKYEVLNPKGDYLYILIHNSVIPKKNDRRTLDVRYFGNLVETISPQVIKSDVPQVKIKVKLKQNVEYNVIQNNNILSIDLSSN